MTETETSPLSAGETLRPLRVPAGFNVLMAGPRVSILRDPKAQADQSLWPLLFGARRSA